MNLHRLTLDEFNAISDSAHMIALRENRSSIDNRYDFALVAEDDNRVILGFMACVELDAEKVLILRGGSFPSAKTGMRTAKAFHLMVQYLREHYVEAKLDTLNTNLRMIKLAYSAGFVIVGVDQQGSDLYVCLRNNFRG